MMTAQEIFDKVVTHLLTQRERSVIMNDDGYVSCAYKNDKGLKCAVGCLIKDEHYTGAIEGFSCEDMNVRDSLFKSGVGPYYLKMLNALQAIHDGCSVSNWEQELKVAASIYGVKWNWSMKLDL